MDRLAWWAELKSDSKILTSRLTRSVEEANHGEKEGRLKEAKHA
jgi:hypothetical protein